VNALANPEVGTFINKHFVSSFQKVATFQIVNGQKQGGNVQNPGEKKPTQGENQGQGMEDRNRGQNQGQDQGQGGERKSA